MNRDTIENTISNIQKTLAEAYETTQDGGVLNYRSLTNASIELKLLIDEAKDQITKQYELVERHDKAAK